MAAIFAKFSIMALTVDGMERNFHCCRRCIINLFWKLLSLSPVWSNLSLSSFSVPWSLVLSIPPSFITPYTPFLLFFSSVLPIFFDLPYQTVCGCELAQGGFFVRQGEYICTLDYQRMYGTRCFSCQDFIEGEVVSALGKTYHPRCFVCASCK